jgi:hypothetical protein
MLITPKIKSFLEYEVLNDGVSQNIKVFDVTKVQLKKTFAGKRKKLNSVLSVWIALYL